MAKIRRIGHDHQAPFFFLGIKRDMRQRNYGHYEDFGHYKHSEHYEYYEHHAYNDQLEYALYEHSL